MDVDDKELFNAAMADEPTPDVATEAPEAPTQEQPSTDGRNRDEHGRFARTEPASQPAQQGSVPEAKEDGANVPSWRLREVREEAERRVAETEARWQRQFEMLQRQNQPKPEPKPVPDLYENPVEFSRYQAQEVVNPLEQRVLAQEARLQAQVEFNSRMYAERDHGPEAVRAAYNWIAEKVQQRDSDALHLYHQVMQSSHPFDAIVTAHKRTSVMQQIGNDPDAWAIQRARELAASDTKYRDALYSQPSRQQSNGNPQGSIVKLPPSMSRLPNAQVSGDDDNDVSDAALFRHAMR
jgi:hypothetical protein